MGKEDRRGLVIESEFARLLAVISREGTTVSAILRQRSDTGSADITVRMKEMHVTGVHLSMIGHITWDELLRRSVMPRSLMASVIVSCGSARNGQRNFRLAEGPLTLVRFRKSYELPLITPGGPGAPECGLPRTRAPCGNACITISAKAGLACSDRNR